MPSSTTTTSQMPVFVYGTLRSGQGNYRHILAGNTDHERPATLPGHKLLEAGVPFAVAQQDTEVVGEVMHVRPDAWPTVLDRLDRLEGYTGKDETSMYIRAVRTVVLADGSHVEAYVYLASQSTLAGRWLRGCQDVPGGDWVKANAA